MPYQLLGESDDTFESCSYLAEKLLGNLASSHIGDLSDSELPWFECGEVLLQVGYNQPLIQNVFSTFEDAILLSIGDRFTEIDECFGPTTHNVVGTVLLNIAEHVAAVGLFDHWPQWSDCNEDLRAKMRNIEAGIGKTYPGRTKLATMLRTERLLFINSAPKSLLDSGEVSDSPQPATYEDYLDAIRICGEKNLSTTRDNIGNIIREELDRTAGNRLLATFRTRLHRRQQ